LGKRHKRAQEKCEVDGEVFHAEGALQVDQCCGSDEFYPKKKSVSRRKPKILKKVK
jgi:hypothetical protein